MENKLRDPNEMVNFQNICIGLATENMNLFGSFNIGSAKFVMLEKLDLQIGYDQNDLVSIYKDLTVERYTYVDKNGFSFVPDKEMMHPASNHLAKITDVKDLREIIREALRIASIQSEMSTTTRQSIISFGQIEETLKEADMTGGTVKIKIGEIREVFGMFLGLYNIAFGNPLIRDISDLLAENDPDKFIK